MMPESFHDSGSIPRYMKHSTRLEAFHKAGSIQRGRKHSMRPVAFYEAARYRTGRAGTGLVEQRTPATTSLRCTGKQLGFAGFGTAKLGHRCCLLFLDEDT
eukprot:981910_1